MLGGMVSLCSLAMCLRTISEWRKRSPQMRQCHWSRAKMYGRHSGFFGSSFGWGIMSALPPESGLIADIGGRLIIRRTAGIQSETRPPTEAASLARFVESLLWDSPRAPRNYHPTVTALLEYARLKCRGVHGGGARFRFAGCN